MQIRPDTLKLLRSRATMSQDDLADASRVSKKTIARIETGKSQPNAITVQRLATALKVKPEDLAKDPAERSDDESVLRDAGLRPLKTWIDGETALAFQMVENVYGISIASQVDMAPLFTALLAEGSLEWRRKRLAEIDEATDQLMTLGSGHLSFANAAISVQDGSIREGLSIKIRDIFGKTVGDDVFDWGYDTSRNNPFADYLKAFAKKLDTKLIMLDPNETDTLGVAGFPDYRVAPERIEEITGGDVMAEHALMRGHASVADMPPDLLTPEKREQRIAWLVAQVPEAERNRLRAQWDEFSRMFEGLSLKLKPSAGGDDVEQP